LIAIMPGSAQAAAVPLQTGHELTIVIGIGGAVPAAGRGGGRRQVGNGDGDSEILECARGSLRHKISRGRGYTVVAIQVSLKASASTL